MKRKAVGLLLAVLICVGMFAGCGGGNPVSTVEKSDMGEKTIYQGVPATHDLNGITISIKDYAVVNQKIAEGYQPYVYALIDFSKKITEEDVSGYTADGDIVPDAFYVGAYGNDKWVWLDKETKYNIDKASEKQLIYKEGVEHRKKGGEILMDQMPAGILMNIMVMDQEDKKPSEEWKSFACQEELSEDRIIEAEADGTITKAGGKISRELKEFIEKDLKEAE